MRLSKMLLPTLRDIPSSAEIPSHQLMMRAGLIRKTAAGIYKYLPLGLKTLRKIENIVREEMESIGAQEIMAPGLIPAKAYHIAGCPGLSVDEVYSLKDREKIDFHLPISLIGSFADIIKSELKSYRSFPVNLYRIGEKFRDIEKPRYGVIRSRVFTAKDSVSFDINSEGLCVSYNRMYDIFCRIFDRCGLKYVAVPESICKSREDSHKFFVISNAGEEEIAYCAVCGFAANVKEAPGVPDPMDKEEYKEMRKVDTPDIRTIKQLADFLKIDIRKLVKTLIFKADSKMVAAVVRGDRELNEAKLKDALNVSALEIADAEAVEKLTHAEVGFAGPVGLETDMLVVDTEVTGMYNFVVGANDTGYHLINVNYTRDFSAHIITDLVTVKEGDRCPKCNSGIRLSRGIKIGHLTKLDVEYSKTMGVTYFDEKGTEYPLFMGEYEINIDRVMAAVIEQNYDNDGIMWPASIAPYSVIVLPVFPLDVEQMEVAEKIYERLKYLGVQVLLDDRDERAGAKFKDADLIGIPLRITIGKKIKEGVLEYKLRCWSKSIDIEIEDIFDRIMDDLNRTNK